MKHSKDGSIFIFEPKTFLIAEIVCFGWTLNVDFFPVIDRIGISRFIILMAIKRKGGILTLTCYHLGGEDVDSRMVDYFADRFQKKFKCDLRESTRALKTLRTVCERAKRTISTAANASILCESLY